MIYHNGSAVILAQHNELDAFGRLLSTPTIETLALYTGRFYDVVTGLQYNRARWYDASVGRWMSVDPIGFEAADANLYRYVGNGVMWQLDPEGMCAAPPVWEAEVKEYEYDVSHDSVTTGSKDFDKSVNKIIDRAADRVQDSYKPKRRRSSRVTTPCPPGWWRLPPGIPTGSTTTAKTVLRRIVYVSVFIPANKSKATVTVDTHVEEALERKADRSNRWLFGPKKVEIRVQEEQKTTTKKGLCCPDIWPF